jgi:uncharacterized membrane protein
MTTAPLLAPHSVLRLKYATFIFIAAMMAYVMVHNESFLVDPSDPIRAHYARFKQYLIPHGLGGAMALLLAPFQFSDRLRAKYTKLHRVAGRFYVAGVFIAAPMGFYIQYWEERIGMTRTFTMAAAVDALLWMSTTAIALFFAMRGQINEHRRWMTRSYAVALVFFEVRMILGVTGLEKLGPGMVEAVVWTCLAFALLIGDLAIQIQEMPKRRALAKAQTA